LNQKSNNKAGIVSYGTSIPSFKIDVTEIANHWGRDGEKIKKSIGVDQKSVANIDEDSTTLSVEAALEALKNIDLPADKLEALYIGSESHPYSVKPTSTIVGNVLGLSENYLSSDIEFACKAGSSAVQIVKSHIEAGQIEYGLAIGADTAQGAPCDALEYTAASGAAAFILGSDPNEVIAEIEGTLSISTDTPDFWRGKNEYYPAHAGRFTGEPAYFKHVLGAFNEITKKTGYTAKDFDHVVFHMPNIKFPLKAAKKLGLSHEQIALGLVGKDIGNTYSACSLLGLTNVLDNAKPNEKILLISYGSGSGSDAFVLNVTDNIAKYKRVRTLKQKVEKLIPINYSEYAFMREKIV